MISANLAAIFYLVSGILFILALRGLSSPDTSRQGNYFGIAGMVIAIVVTFLSIGNFSTSLVYVVIFLVIGGAIGAFIAFKIPMTDSQKPTGPHRAAALNGTSFARRDHHLSTLSIYTVSVYLV